MGISVVDGVITLGSFITVTIGILVLFVGRRLTQVIGFLKEYNIPQPVSGGLFFSVIFSLLYTVFNIEISFNLTARDVLLVYFFTTIGINASVADLVKGGKPLLYLLIITVCFMLIQNFTGIGIAGLFDLSPATGLLTSSISLVGGHGTAIAWAPSLASDYNVHNAMEIGLASATFGLILASIIGGPLAKFLINKHNLTPQNKSTKHSVKTDNLNKPQETKKPYTKTNDYHLLDSLFAIHVCMIIGFFIHEYIEYLGIKLPLFVSCLFSGIILTNTIPKTMPLISGLAWPAKSESMRIIADISLGTFLAMSLMSLQLFSLIDLAGPMLVILIVQFLLVMLIAVFIVFPIMGKDYNSAVICAGFCGYSLGATPTAMANMNSITDRYGPSPLSLIIVPLVCAFFIDIVNAIIIPWFLNAFI